MSLIGEISYGLRSALKPVMNKRAEGPRWFSNLTDIIEKSGWRYSVQLPVKSKAILSK